MNDDEFNIFAAIEHAGAIKSAVKVLKSQSISRISIKFTRSEITFSGIGLDRNAENYMAGYIFKIDTTRLAKYHYDPRDEQGLYFTFTSDQLLGALSKLNNNTILNIFQLKDKPSGTIGIQWMKPTDTRPQATISLKSIEKENPTEYVGDTTGQLSVSADIDVEGFCSFCTTCTANACVGMIIDLAKDHLVLEGFDVNNIKPVQSAFKYKPSTITIGNAKIVVDGTIPYTRKFFLSDKTMEAMKQMADIAGKDYKNTGLRIFCGPENPLRIEIPFSNYGVCQIFISESKTT